MVLRDKEFSSIERTRNSVILIGQGILWYLSGREFCVIEWKRNPMVLSGIFTIAHLKTKHMCVNKFKLLRSEATKVMLTITSGHLLLLLVLLFMDVLSYPRMHVYLGG